jgi:multicomponent Na+:H+ antiporter subunit C
MNLVLILTISVCVGAGVLLVLSRDAFRIVLGFVVLGGAVNLIVFMAGRPGAQSSPVIPAGAETLVDNFANPLTQALVLTAIVIGFALLCFGLILAARVSEDHGHTDVSRQKACEPQADASSEDPYKPPVMEQD